MRKSGQILVIEDQRLFDGPEAVAKYFQTDVNEVLKSLNNGSRTHEIDKMHIVWADTQRYSSQKPVAVINRNWAFSSIRDMSMILHIHQDSIRSALKGDGKLYGYEIKYIDRDELDDYITDPKEMWRSLDE